MFFGLNDRSLLHCTSTPSLWREGGSDHDSNLFLYRSKAVVYRCLLISLPDKLIDIYSRIFFLFTYASPVLGGSHFFAKSKVVVAAVLL